ncbi:MAG: ribulose-phosphate 3-epimerase [Desulfamplus sp.]|nr:ribulose-phosphate 3-epimerase [Desulfamplus sp.]
MRIIAPSILSADFTKLGQELKDVESAGADWIHIDVMDGHFVPNITYGPIIVEACKKATALALDVHLMIEKPDLMIPEFVNAGADLISVHAEACTHLHRTIQYIKSFKSARCANENQNNEGSYNNANSHNDGDSAKSSVEPEENYVKAGVALNPGTPLSAVEWVIEEVDFVLIMSVNPGFGGQKFIPSSLEKIKSLAVMIKDRNSKAIIQVDGGVSPKTISRIADAGATSFVAGSAIFNSSDYKETIDALRD